MSSVKPASEPVKPLKQLKSQTKSHEFGAEPNENGMVNMLMPRTYMDEFVRDVCTMPPESAIKLADELKRAAADAITHQRANSSSRL